MSYEFKLGLCYEVTLADGSMISFRVLGNNEFGLMMIESPPGSGIRSTFQEITRIGHVAIRPIACNEED